MNLGERLQDDSTLLLFSLSLSPLLISTRLLLRIRAPPDTVHLAERDGS